MASNLQIMLVNINLFYSYDGLKSDEAFDFKALQEALSVMDYHNKTDLKGKINLGTPIPYCLIPSDKNSFRTSCSAGWMYAGIDIAGNVRICPWSSKILGNVLDTPLSDIWTKSKELIYYRDNSWMDTLCDECQVRTECGGGCKVTSSDPPYTLPTQWKPYVNSGAFRLEEKTNEVIDINDLLKEINQTKFLPDPNIRIRKEENGFSVYVPMKGAYWLNDSAIKIYYLICKEPTIEAAVKVFAEQNSIDLVTAENDVKHVLYKLYNMHLFEQDSTTV